MAATSLFLVLCVLSSLASLLDATDPPEFGSIRRGQWSTCYSEDELSLHVHDALVTPFLTVENGIAVAVDLNFSLPLSSPLQSLGDNGSSVTWTLQFWHEETGSRINYKGPYDVCCNFLVSGRTDCARDEDDQALLNSQCPITNQYDSNGTLVPLAAHIFKTLHKDISGNFEAVLRVVADMSDVVREGEDDGSSNSDEHYTSSEELLCLVLPFELELKPEGLPSPSSSSPRTSAEMADDLDALRQEQEIVPMLA
eukprot:TRINITY_DN2188_c0_g3_i1.p1 TRINITY_DN2188_c0_g3~~TRINITY_DN2188_c0_g3_i1.p1  ORF type:complete len:254 (+),score=48.16 TRINITY_DN2188_c0_g3_i1:151-912(+)